VGGSERVGGYAELVGESGAGWRVDCEGIGVEDGVGEEGSGVGEGSEEGG